MLNSSRVILLINDKQDIAETIALIGRLIHMFICLSPGQQRLPDLLKLVRRLHAKKRVSMLHVSARLGISVGTDKPAILARSSARPTPTRYAFPVSSSQNSTST